MTFSEWIGSVFDQPVALPERYCDLADSFWDGPPATVVDYMMRLFTEAETALDPFSDAHATQGLYAVISNSLTDYPLMLTDPSVPVRARLDCIETMEVLFRRYFAHRCSPHLSHLDTAAGTPAHVSPLNGVCYMWWDVLPLHGLSRHRPELADGPELDRAVFSAIRNILELDSIACQESAILGLLEWSPYYDETNKVAEDFLNRSSGIPPELRAFAARLLIDLLHKCHFVSSWL